MSIIDGGGQTVEGKVGFERWKKAGTWSAWYNSYSDCNTLLTMTGYEVMDGESVSDVQLPAYFFALVVGLPVCASWVTPANF